MAGLCLMAASNASMACGGVMFDASQSEAGMFGAGTSNSNAEAMMYIGGAFAVYALFRWIAKTVDKPIETEQGARPGDQVTEVLREA